MVRQYQCKRNAARHYASCTAGALSGAVASCRSGKSIRKSCDAFKVKKSTLSDKLLGKHTKHYGRPTALKKRDEEILAGVLDKLADWNFPVGNTEIKVMVKDLLDARGEVSNHFRNNTPGDDWVRNFKKRNSCKTTAATNIKPSRAGVSADDIKQFFDNLEETLEGENVPPSNIFNYDETNFKDEPGRQWVIVRRGRRRTEKVIENSKSQISVMWCCSGDGQMLAPMIVYKAENRYENWTKNGPKGAIYESSPSGYFDSRLFAKWFFEILVPAVKDLTGVKILFGDNLASHFNYDIICTCIDLQIKFTMLVANATDKMQVLDVSVFAPMKRSWRTVLTDYRQETRRRGSIEKCYFPTLLVKLLNQIQSTLAANIIAGFRTCGLIPIDRNQVLKKLPSIERISEDADVSAVFNSTLVSLLEENRAPATAKQQKRGKKVVRNVFPGKPLEPCNFIEDDKNQEEGDDITGDHAFAPEQSGSLLPNNFVDSSITDQENFDSIFDILNRDIGELQSSPRPKISCHICFKKQDEKYNGRFLKWNIPVLSDDESDDEVEWSQCSRCDRWYHKDCLIGSVGPEECFFCDFEP